MRFTAAEVAAAVGGEVVGDPAVVVDGASQDSRVVEPGQLFVPLVAERDGHDFIDAATERGATAHLTAHRDRVAPGTTAIVVADTASALVALGVAARARIDGEVVGVTGSVGKTTVKDLARAVLATDAPTHASDRSFNNEIGVPLTLVNAPDAVRRVVVEMGARGAGHIAQLCAVAQPTIGVVTRVAMAHGEMFGSIDDIARGKGELVEALPASGVAVLNAGDERVAAMAERAVARVLTYGVDAGEVRATLVEVGPDLRLRVVLETPWGRIEATPSVRGAHNAENAAAAAAVGLAAGVAPVDVAAGLAAAVVSPLRMAVTRSKEGAVVLDDTYNANPTSMRAALDALSHVPATRRIAVVGLMAELGSGSDEEHEAIAALAADRGVELVAVDAPQYRAPSHGGCDVADVDAAVAAVGGLGPTDAVLVKGSRVAGLERVVARLLEG